MRTLTLWWRRWKIRNDFTKHEPDKHPGLQPFQARELVSVKGVQFRVAARYTDPEPCLILEPVGSTVNRKIARLKELRRDQKFELAQRPWARGVRHVD